MFVPFHSRQDFHGRPVAEVSNTIGTALASANGTAPSAPGAAARAPQAATNPQAAASASVSTAVVTDHGGVYDEAKRAYVFQRYCHVYAEGELRDLVASVGGCTLIEEYYDTGNHCLLIEKDTT